MSAIVVLQITGGGLKHRRPGGLIQPEFVAGVVVKNGVVVQTAPILKWARGWAVTAFIERVVKNRWLLEVVASNHPEDRAEDPLLPSVEEDPGDVPLPDPPKPTVN